MLKNWLRPVSPDLLEELNLKDFHFGNNIKIHQKKLPKLVKGQVALIGLNEDCADAVRRQLYLLSFNFSGTFINDLGNARRTEPDFLIQLIHDLLESKIIPVFIGIDPALSLTQFKAHRMVQSAVNLAVIDEKIAYNTGNAEESWLDFILDNSRSKLFQLSLLGIQTHFLPPQIIDHLSARKHSLIRLGRVKADLQKTEPTLRNVDALCVNISALKSADAPAQKMPSPSGLFSEEICQLMRYAGMSEKLSSAGFYGFVPELDHTQQTAKTLAQIIWYFLDGFHNRRNDYPASNDNMVEYVTHIQDYNWQLTFWRSNKTGRWWLQVPIKTKKNLQRHRLIPCTYENYTQAVNGELPEEFLGMFERFE